MKVGIDIRCLAESKYSGISEYTYNLVYHLLTIDKKNQYFLFYNSAKEHNIPKFNFPNVTYKGYKYPNKLFNLSLRFLKFTSLDKLIGGVDIFLTPTFLFTNLSKDCKKILVIHDLSFELYPEFFTFKKRLWHDLIGTKNISQESDEIIAISENTKNDVLNLYGVKEDKIKVIYQGINEQFFKDINQDDINKVKNKYNLPDNYIFYLGNLEPRKNIESLILAFDQLENKSIHLVIAGSQAWKYKKIYKLWQNSKSKNRINFLGYVDSEDKPALYTMAKIFVYPSIYEGFGLPPLEAMACKTPVITSFTSSLVESVGEAGLLIDPNNFNELAQAINKLIDDEKLQQSLSVTGYEYSKKFRWNNTAQEILNIINQ